MHSDINIDALINEKPILDRSTLEAWGRCPRQAWHRLHTIKDDISIPAVSGSRVHEAISVGVTLWVESGGKMRPQEVSDGMRYILETPDEEGEHMDAIADAQQLSGTLNGFAWWLAKRFPNSWNILRWDGGAGERSGQLAWEMDEVTVTSELDLLAYGDSKEQMIDYDWKTGWKHWTTTDIKKAFQFRMHAWLLFRNFDQLREVIVRIWNARHRDWTPGVAFTRRDVEDTDKSIRQAVDNWRKWSDVSAQDRVPAWPMAETCRLCPALVLCDLKTPTEAMLSVDSGIHYVAAIRQREEQLAQMKASATEWVKAGQPLNGWGEKPRTRITYGFLEDKSE